MTTERSEALDQGLDDPGFEEFFLKEWPRVVAYVRAAFDLTLPAAEDVAQDAFASICQRWHAVTSPGAYVRAAATRIALRRSPETPVDDIGGLLDGTDGTASPPPEEGHHLIQSALRQLPGQQRAVFALHLDDYPDSEIAGILGLTSATVRSYRRHARRTLARWHRQQDADRRTQEGPR